MHELLEKFLAKKGPEVSTELQGKIGLDAKQATGFVEMIVQRAASLFKSGDLDIKALMGGADLSAITSKFDIGDLTAKTGLSTEKATEGLNTVLSSITETAKSKSGLLGGLAARFGGK